MTEKAVHYAKAVYVPSASGILHPEGTRVFFLFFLLTLCCPNGNLSHGKFGSLSPRKATCN